MTRVNLIKAGEGGEAGRFHLVATVAKPEAVV